MSILAKLQKIDRRIIYLLMVLVVACPLIWPPKSHPSMIAPEVQNAFDVIDRVPPGKIVILSDVWGPGTEAENGPQTAALMRHMFQKGIRFAVVSWDQAGATMTYEMGKDLEAEMHKTYGTDWVHFGFKVLDSPVLLGMGRDLPAIMNTDYNGKRVAGMPVMKGIKGGNTIGAVAEITPSGTLEGIMTYLTQNNGIPLVYCPTAVMSVEAYKYIDSGQVKGMLNSAVGAAQYEKLIGVTGVTQASTTTWALSSAHIFIILLIVIGNLGYIAARRTASREVE